MASMFFGLVTFKVISESVEKTRDLNTVSAHMGVTSIASIVLSSTGPPAEREYPVEPVCVATIMPSAWHFKIGLLSLKISACRIFDGSPVEITTSFNASGNVSSPIFTESLVHFSSLNSSLRILSIALYASLGSTSVKNPLTPIFIPKMGGSGFGLFMHVRSIVPSPPMVIIKSVFIFLSGTASACTFILSANVSSMKTFMPLLCMYFASSSANCRAISLSKRATIPAVLNTMSPFKGIPYLNLYMGVV